MNLRLSMMLVAVLLIFGGTVLVVRFTGSEESEPECPWLYRVDEDAIVDITVSYGGQTADYFREAGSLDWFIRDDPVVPVNKDKWGGVPLLFSGPRCDRVLAGAIENPAAYGLEPPLTKGWITDRTGRVIEFHLGEPTPDGNNQYARLVGAPGLYTVASSWAQVINKLATEPPYPPAEAEGTPAPG